MDYNIEILIDILPLIKDFLYHLASYRLINAYLDSLPGEREFWVYTCNAHLETATLAWCMVFGSDSNETHWKKIFKGYNENAKKLFLTYLQAESSIAEDDFQKYWDDITTFRNNFIAHKASYKEPVPNFDSACTIVFCFSSWFHQQFENNCINFPNFKELFIEYQNDIEKTLLEIIMFKN
ncbi:MAG: hypothetical protein GX051_04285 [Clostridiales bacterium]|nr:hypothetical protein [Clostridiales bacterium]